MNNILEVRNLHVAYDEHVVLESISFDLKEKENMIVYSGQKMGTSSFIFALQGMIPGATGDVIIDGINIMHTSFSKRIEFSNRIPLVYETGGLLHSLSVLENILLPMKKLGTYDGRLLTNLLNDFGIYDYKPFYMDDLNDYDTKRVNIVRSILMQPNIILFDEFDSGMTDSDTLHIFALVRKYQDIFNFATIVTTVESIGSALYEGYTPYSLLSDGFKKL